MAKMITNYKRGVIGMGEFKPEKNYCICLSCMYLIQATKTNEDANGSYDLKIYCGIKGCPKGYYEKITKQHVSEAFKKISHCIDILRRCIDLKSKGGESSE